VNAAVVYTPKPLTERELEDEKKYVEEWAPLKRGWTGEWSIVRPGLYVYTRRNSLGKPVRTEHSLEIVITAK